MKEGWKYVKLGDLCNVINGLWKGKKEPFVNVGVIRNANFTKEFTLNYDNIEYLDVEQRQYSKRKLCKGDIIVEKSGGSEKQPVGRCVLFLKEDGEFSFSNFTSVLRIKDSSCILYYYLYYCLLFYYKRGDTKKMQNAATGIHNIIFDLFLSLEIPLPPLSEQEDIVTRLDSSFAKIDAVKANAKRELDEAKALFQSALSEMMKPKEGWEEKKLGEIANYGIGLTYKPSDVCSNGTIVLRSSNIQNEKLDLKDIVRVNCKIKQDLFVKPGDILMCSRNGSARLVGKVAMIPNIKEAMTYGTFMMVISSRYNNYLYYFFRSELFRKQIKHGEANMINQITRYMLDDVFVCLPPLSEQESIVSRLDAISEKVKKIEACINTTVRECDALKQAILKEIFE